MYWRSMIVVDLAGGDFAPQAVIEGCLLFKNKYSDCELILSGTKTEKQLIADTALVHCQFLEAQKVAEMEKSPIALKLEKSITTVEAGLDYIKKANCGVFFSAGNSGSVILSALSILGLKAGIELPVFAPSIPLYQNTYFLLLDAGATANRILTGTNLLAFAEMGKDFYCKIHKNPNPRIALLNVGSEKHKGRPEHKEAYQLLIQSKLNFIGNVEPDDLLNHKAEIVVTDGFTGNMVLKMMEAFSSLINMNHKRGKLEEKISGNFDYEKVGGAPLLGINGRVVVGHGKSTAKAIFSGLEFCRNYYLF